MYSKKLFATMIVLSALLIGCGGGSGGSSSGSPTGGVYSSPNPIGDSTSGGDEAAEAAYTALKEYFGLLNTEEYSVIERAWGRNYFPASTSRSGFEKNLTENRKFANITQYTQHGYNSTAETKLPSGVKYATVYTDYVSNHFAFNDKGNGAYIDISIITNADISGKDALFDEVVGQVEGKLYISGFIVKYNGNFTSAQLDSFKNTLTNNQFDCITKAYECKKNVTTDWEYIIRFNGGNIIVDGIHSTIIAYIERLK
ncbi:MAG: hypothetical protein LBT96_05360 [Campylobacteraceae bacterium]|jgi:hypothetical protein|nr:hypothetical protein [Campylobacteraceae bacterium]